MNDYPQEYHLHVNENLPTVAEFCEHIGIYPLADTLRAIDKYNTEAVDIMIDQTDEWITPDNARSKPCSDHDPIAKICVHGIAWDGTDWEWDTEIDCNHADWRNHFDNARQAFADALEEHELDMAEANWKPDATPTRNPK